MLAATAALSWRAVWARWLCAAIGTVVMVMALPFLWSTTSAVGLPVGHARRRPGFRPGRVQQDRTGFVGCLVLTVVAIAAADVARPARALNAVLGVGLMRGPLVFAGDRWLVAASIGRGLALVLLSVRRGPIRERYGAWSRLLV